MKKRSPKKITITALGSFILLFLGFRIVPLLTPVEKADINQSGFHSVKFYDRNNNLLQEVLSRDARRSVRVPLSAVSPYFVDAMIATEDGNFYDHSGVDYLSLLRACVQNVASGRVVSGASTITLQLARLIHPAPRNIFNKIKEAYFAYRLEAGLTKDEILEEYVNRLPMSGNLYGVESAARAYFGINGSDLTLAQATFLASIPNSPTRLNPYKNLEGVMKRQETVLERMVAQGMIPGERVERVIKEDVRLKPHDASFKAPHFVFNLLKSLPDSVQSVTTTIDLGKQAIISEEIRKVLSQLRQFHVTNAAALLLDNQSGEVLAYVGSADYFDETIDGQFDAVQALRQPGSTLKPFLYLLAMENGFNPATPLSDIPTHYRMPTGVYAPQNYSESFRGPVRLREALANSLNVPAVRTIARFGTQAFLTRMHEYGFDSLVEPAEYYGVGLALGGGEVTLHELTRAYMCLARMGSFIESKSIPGVDNQTEPGNPATDVRISTPELNYLIADILSDTHARTAEFGFDSVLKLPFRCSAKTGTSFRFSDNWTVGFTEDYTLGVWVGNFDHSPMQKVSGVTGAGPIFARIMMSLYQNGRKPGSPERPDSLIDVGICAVSGQGPKAECPSTLTETIPVRDRAAFVNGVCEMHKLQDNVVTTIYPKRFQQWAKQMGFKTSVENDDNLEHFKITNPKVGSEYYRLPNLAPEYQSVKFELNTQSASAVKWYLNDELLRTTEKEHGFLWQIEPGNYQLTAISVADTRMRSETAFTVH
jgi:penicillin-binding protein 1C